MKSFEVIPHIDKLRKSRLKRLSVINKNLHIYSGSQKKRLKARRFSILRDIELLNKIYNAINLRRKDVECIAVKILPREYYKFTINDKSCTFAEYDYIVDKKTIESLKVVNPSLHSRLTHKYNFV